MFLPIHFLTSHLFPFFFNDSATTEIYTLSLHDALPISRQNREFPVHRCRLSRPVIASLGIHSFDFEIFNRSEEHTSELQSHSDLVCRLLLEKKKKKEYSLSSTLFY